MTGIKMTSARRSQLLEQLLKQNEAMLSGGAQSGGEVGLKLLAQFLRQKQMDKLQGEEAAATKTQGARQAAMLNAALEKPATDFQNRQIMDGGQVNDLGRTIQGSQSPQGPADLSALLGQSMGIDPQDPVAGALFEAEIKKAYTPPPPPQPPIVKTFYDGDERVNKQWDPVSGEWVEMGRGKTKGQTINVGGESLFKVPTGFMLKNPNDPTEGVVPIPGGPKDTLSPEQAAKVQLVETALQSSENFRKYIINEDGSINRTNIYTMFTNAPFSEGREAKVYLLDAIEAKLRAESGAAVPETEVTRAGKRFNPHPFDSDSTVRVKADLLYSFLEGTFNKSQRDGRFDLEGTLSAVEKAAAEKFDELGAAMVDTTKIPGFDQLSPEDQKTVVDQLILESRGVK